MQYLKTFEGRQQWRIYGGKETIWYKPKIGDYYHITSPHFAGSWADWVCIAEIVGFDPRFKTTVYYVAVGLKDGINEIKELQIPMGKKDYVFRPATKEEIQRHKKIMTTKRFDL